MECLQDHEPLAESSMQAVLDYLQTPASQVDVQDVACFIEEHKKKLKVVDADVKDAKRRITLAKGPRPRKAKGCHDPESESDEVPMDDPE